MRNLRKTIPVLVLLALLLALPVRGLASGETLVNPALEGDGIPEDWRVESYLSDGYTVSAEGGVVTLSASDYNDLRLIQRVEAEENTVYTLTAEIAAAQIAGGRGASLSIDNFSIDGSYIYSDGISGSADWQTATLSFRTGEGQTAINVALRLGGYSEMSRGTAYFRNVRLEAAGEGAVGVQALTAGSTAAESGVTSDGGMTESRRIQLKSYLHLFVVIAAAAGVLLLFGVYRNRETLASIPLTETNTKRFFLLAVLLGLALRSVLASAWGGHDTDMSCWMGWGNYIAQNGPATFYTAPGHEWYDYPPGYMLVLGLIARVLQALQISAGARSATFAYMLPAYAADAVSALVLMRTARREGFSLGWQLLLGVLVIFNPAAVMLSGAWGQIDSILTLFLLLSFLELVRGRRVSAGALFGLAVMVKWQALIYGPVLAAAYLFHLRSKKDLRDTALGVAAALAVILVISLPFRGEQGLFWVVGRFLNAAGGYDYASVEAYNFLALLDGNWAPASEKMLFGISYKAFGTAAVLLSVAGSVYIQFRSARPALSGGEDREDRSTLFLAAGFCMYAIFTFGHYMHERYVFPVMLLLLFVFVFTREANFFFCSLLLSVVLFLNEMTAMYVISELASAVVRSSREHRAVVTICSLAETVSFLIFLRVTISHIFPRQGEEVSHA